MVFRRWAHLTKPGDLQGYCFTDIIGRAQRLHRVLTNTKFDFLFGFWKFCSESRFSAF